MLLCVRIAQIHIQGDRTNLPDFEFFYQQFRNFFECYPLFFLLGLNVVSSNTENEPTIHSDHDIVVAAQQSSNGWVVGVHIGVFH